MSGGGETADARAAELERRLADAQARASEEAQLAEAQTRIRELESRNTALQAALENEILDHSPSAQMAMLEVDAWQRSQQPGPPQPPDFNAERTAAWRWQLDAYLGSLPRLPDAA